MMWIELLLIHGVSAKTRLGILLFFIVIILFSSSKRLVLNFSVPYFVFWWFIEVLIERVFLVEIKTRILFRLLSSFIIRTLLLLLLLHLPLHFPFSLPSLHLSLPLNSLHFSLFFYFFFLLLLDLSLPFSLSLSLFFSYPPTLIRLNHFICKIWLLLIWVFFEILKFKYLPPLFNLLFSIFMHLPILLLIKESIFIAIIHWTLIIWIIIRKLRILVWWFEEIICNPKFRLYRFCLTLLILVVVISGKIRLLLIVGLWSNASKLPSFIF